MIHGHLPVVGLSTCKWLSKNAVACCPNHIPTRFKTAKALVHESMPVHPFTQGEAACYRALHSSPSKLSAGTEVRVLRKPAWSQLWERAFVPVVPLRPQSNQILSTQGSPPRDTTVSKAPSSRSGSPCSEIDTYTAREKNAQPNHKILQCSDRDLLIGLPIAGRTYASL